MVPNMLLVPGRGKDTLVALINASNALPQPLTTDELTFGPPSLNTTLDNGTNLVLIPRLESSIYAGRIQVLYQRMNLSQAFYGIVPEVKAPGGADLYSLIPAINLALGLELTSEEFDNVSLNWLASGGQVYIELRAKAESVAYTGGFRVKYYRTKKTLAEVLKDLELALFSYPNVTAGKRSLSMLTHDLDFSADRASLKINGGRWASPTAIATLMANAGFASFPSAAGNILIGLTDLPTTAVSGANTEYDRVVVQRNVLGGDYAGDAYFHYNLL